MGPRATSDDDAPAISEEETFDGPAVLESGEDLQAEAHPESGDETTALRDPLLGQMLGEYRVESRLGVGGMGIVYRGSQPVIGKPVAIKVLRPELSDSPSSVQRLLDEARAASAIRHPAIIEIFSFGQTPDGRQYFVMELLEGESLDKYLAREGRLPATEVARLLIDVLGPLEAAHRAGVVHRDLKPSNIFLVGTEPSAPMTKLLDFGLAQAQPAAEPTPRVPTPYDEVAGTPSYMAPEQVRGEAVGPAADLYAVGVMIHELLTGHVPFELPLAVEVMDAHLSAPLPAPPADLTVPAPLWRLLERLMSKRPGARPRSALAVRDELWAILERLDAPAPVLEGAEDEFRERTVLEVTTVEKSPLPLSSGRSSPWRSLGAFAAGLGLTGVLVWMLVRPHAEAREPESARPAASMATALPEPGEPEPEPEPAVTSAPGAAKPVGERPARLKPRPKH